MSSVPVSQASTLNEFKPSLQLQTVKPTARSVVSSLPNTVSDAAEARYWSESFGLGKHQGSLKKYAHYRSALLHAGSSAVVHQILLDQRTLAVASGPRVKVYGSSPQSALSRTLNRHRRPEQDEQQIVNADQNISTGHLATCAQYRHDGQLLAIGTDHGQVKVHSSSSRATLVTFTATSLPIRALAWFRDGQRLLAAGDDGVLRVYRLGQAEAECSLTGHGDAIRGAVLWQQQEQSSNINFPKMVAATASYDHTIRLWNLDTTTGNDTTSSHDRCMAVLSHGAPVQCVLWMPSRNPNVPCWLLSAGGTTVQVWNPRTGTCVCRLTTHHRKAITCLVSTTRHRIEDSSTTPLVRIVTAGLDGLIRIHSWDGATGQVQHLHGIATDHTITALAMQEKRVAIGTAHGQVLVRQAGPSKTASKRQREPLAGTFRFFTRGQNVNASAGDYVVRPEGKKRKLQPFDVALKQFRYGDALDQALETRIPQVVVAVLEELGQRRGLTIALSNRDEESLEPVLSFTVRYIRRPRFAALLIGVAHKLLDIYQSVAGQSELIDELFLKLQAEVKAERRAQTDLLRIVGQLDALLTAAEMEPEEPPSDT